MGIKPMNRRKQRNSCRLVKRITIYSSRYSGESYALTTVLISKFNGVVITVIEQFCVLFLARIYRKMNAARFQQDSYRNVGWT